MPTVCYKIFLSFWIVFSNILNTYAECLKKNIQSFLCSFLQFHLAFSNILFSQEWVSCQNRFWLRTYFKDYEIMKTYFFSFSFSDFWVLYFWIRSSGIALLFWLSLATLQILFLVESNCSSSKITYTSTFLYSLQSLDIYLRICFIHFVIRVC